MILKRNHHVNDSNEDFKKMPHTNKIPLTEINERITCALCKGYFIDATTIIECLHTFCRSCIVKYLETHKYCPICDVQVHKTKPLANIRPDKIIQDIVYKLVPRLYHDEMRRRREFYSIHTEAKPSVLEERNEVTYEYILTSEENVCIALNYSGFSGSPRYLKCPAAVTVGHLERLIIGKYDLSQSHRVTVFYNDDALHSHSTLMEIAYIYSWRRKGPLELTYRIYENRTKRLKIDTEESTATTVNNNNNNNWKEVQLRISENGEISVTGIQDDVKDAAEELGIVIKGSSDDEDNRDLGPREDEMMDVDEPTVKPERKSHRKLSNGSKKSEVSGAVKVKSQKVKSPKSKEKREKKAKRGRRKKNHVEHEEDGTINDLQNEFKKDVNKNVKESTKPVDSFQIEETANNPNDFSRNSQEPSRNLQESSRHSEEPSRRTEEPSRHHEEPSRNSEELSRNTVEPCKNPQDHNRNLHESNGIQQEPSGNIQEPSWNLQELSGNLQERSRNPQEPSGNLQDMNTQNNKEINDTSMETSCGTSNETINLSNICKDPVRNEKGTIPDKESIQEELKSQNTIVDTKENKRTPEEKSLKISSDNNSESLDDFSIVDSKTVNLKQSESNGNENDRNLNNERHSLKDSNGTLVKAVCGNVEKSNLRSDTGNVSKDHQSTNNKIPQNAEHTDKEKVVGVKNFRNVVKILHDTIISAPTEQNSTNLQDRNRNLQEPSGNLPDPSKNMQEPNRNLQESSRNQQEPSRNLQEPSRNLQEPIRNLEEPSRNPKNLLNSLPVSNKKNLVEIHRIEKVQISGFPNVFHDFKTPIASTKTVTASCTLTASTLTNSTADLRRTKHKLEEKADYEPAPKQPTILNHTLGLQNLSNNHPLKKHALGKPEVAVNSSKAVKTPASTPCYMPRSTVYSPVINVPKPQTSSQAKQSENTTKKEKIPPATILNSKVSIKPKSSAPMGYKTLRDPPKSWNPQIARPTLNRNEPKSPADLKNSRPPKFFKIRNNLPRYLGNPASGVKPMYQLHVSPEKDKSTIGGTADQQQQQQKTEIKKHSIVKIDPKTLKPISERAPETSNLCRTTTSSSQESQQIDLKINASSVSIFNPLKLQSCSGSPKNDRKSPHSPKVKGANSTSPPGRKDRVNLNFTPSNPFIPNLGSPTMSPNQFLFPGPHPSFTSYDPRMMAAYQSFYSRLPFVSHLGINLDMARKSFEMATKPNTTVPSLPSTSAPSGGLVPLPPPPSKSNNITVKKKDKNEKSLQNAVERLTQNKIKEATTKLETTATIGKENSVTVTVEKKNEETTTLSKTEPTNPVSTGSESKK